MLDAYNAWRAEPTTETRAEFMRQSQAYTQPRSDFDADELVN